MRLPSGKSGIERRQRMGHGARNMAGGEFVRLAHIDEEHRAVAEDPA